MWRLRQKTHIGWANARLDLDGSMRGALKVDSLDTYQSGLSVMATEKRQVFAGGANYVWMTYIKLAGLATCHEVC